MSVQNDTTMIDANVSGMQAKSVWNMELCSIACSVALHVGWKNARSVALHFNHVALHFKASRTNLDKEFGRQQGACANIADVRPDKAAYELEGFPTSIVIMQT